MGKAVLYAAGAVAVLAAAFLFGHAPFVESRIQTAIEDHNADNPDLAVTLEGLSVRPADQMVAAASVTVSTPAATVELKDLETVVESTLMLTPVEQVKTAQAEEVTVTDRASGTVYRLGGVTVGSLDLQGLAGDGSLSDLAALLSATTLESLTIDGGTIPGVDGVPVEFARLTVSDVADGIIQAIDLEGLVFPEDAEARFGALRLKDVELADLPGFVLGDTETIWRSGAIEHPDADVLTSACL